MREAFPKLRPAYVTLMRHVSIIASLMSVGACLRLGVHKLVLNGSTCKPLEGDFCRLSAKLHIFILHWCRIRDPIIRVGFDGIQVAKTPTYSHVHFLLHCVWPQSTNVTDGRTNWRHAFKAAFHDTDTDILAKILARILADTSDTRDFVARMSVSVSMSVSCNATFSNSASSMLR